jgi:hypothetical protein
LKKKKQAKKHDLATIFPNRKVRALVTACSDIGQIDWVKKCLITNRVNA